MITAQNPVEQRDIFALTKCSGAKTRTVLLILAVAFAAFMVFCMVVGSTGKNFGYCIAGLIWCALVYAFVFLLNPRLTYRSFCRRYDRNAVVSYKFKDKKVGITLENGGGNLLVNKNISDLFRCYETTDHFFIYVKRNETYILRKNAITEGSPAELSQLLEKEMGSKLVRKVNVNANL